MNAPRHPARWRELGMARPIDRRDFLHGLAVGSALLATSKARALGAGAAAAATPYPPGLTGLRGSRDGTFEAAHALRDGETWPQAADSGEHYDLIVVGAGISGLAAAHFYRARAGRGARVLLLDNHDDFGGHARRNEFEIAGRMLLQNGGTLEIDSPRPYSAVADGLLRVLGIEVEALARRTEQREYYQRHGFAHSYFLDRETFGTDHLIVCRSGSRWPALLRDAPLPAETRANIARIEEARVDYLAGLSLHAKLDRLSRQSYRAYLSEVVGADPLSVAFYQARTHAEWGVGIDAVSALDCWGWDLPGFSGLGLALRPGVRMGETALGYRATGGSYRLHFPDGNASIARLLVRSLIPGVLAGSTAEDVVMARADYARLDEPGNSVRLRLNATVVRVENVASAGATPQVRVTFVQDGQVRYAIANDCVLACWNMVIPHICPELPERQKAALHALVKTPLVYTSVVLRDGRALRRLGTHHIHAPGSYHADVMLNRVVHAGGYTSPRAADGPVLLRMERTPCRPGWPESEQNRAGRAELLATPFSTFEYQVRDQLARSLGSGGFDPAADIAALTVNRWPHGYAPEYNPLFDPDLPEQARPHAIGRAQCGRITIANSDSAASSYTDAAIDQAHRAVEELLRG